MGSESIISVHVIVLRQSPVAGGLQLMVNWPDGKVVVAQMGTCRSRPTPTVIIMEEID